jgi:cell division protein FtsX
VKIATFIMSLVQPLIARILTALGFSVVSIVGVSTSINSVKDQLISSVNSMPADVLNIFLLGGGGIGLGMILGAIAFRLTLWQIQSATKILGVNPG